MPDVLDEIRQNGPLHKSRVGSKSYAVRLSALRQRFFGHAEVLRRLTHHGFILRHALRQNFLDT